MTITINGSGTIGGPTTFTDNVTLGTSLLATPSGATPSYLCRAWVNFNGTGTVAIRASGNVTSITDNSAGNYTINFTTAMPDINYSVVGTAGVDGTYGSWSVSPFSNGVTSTAPTTTAVRITLFVAAIGAVDSPYVSLSIFR